MHSCQTRYPILLLHGMGFHDTTPHHWYWGRIPEALKQHGAEVYFGNQDGNATIEFNARLLVSVVKRILRETGAEKLNIIAHSKGGAEARCMISTMGMGDSIASVTTIATPHHGSPTIDWLLAHFDPIIRMGSTVMDGIRLCCGDFDPQTYLVIRELSTGYMQDFNQRNLDDPRVYYQSFAFLMKRPLSDPLMSIPNAIVSCFEGKNDGMVSLKNARWTNFRGIYSGTSQRGISHPDEIDYMRMPFTRKNSDEDRKISDITNFYLDVVRELKRRGF